MKFTWDKQIHTWKFSKNSEAKDKEKILKEAQEK